MKKNITIILLTFASILSLGQIKFTEPKLNIKHGDLTIYLDSDTNSFITKHELKYSDFKKLDSDRDDRWFQDTYKGIYNKEYYVRTGYDLGHLTPSHITSYNDTLNHESFSLFNQAPQLAAFNRGKWAQLERGVEDSIAKYKTDVTIITGVIYDNKNKMYLNKSRIKIPDVYYKILIIKQKKKPLTYVWVGSNVNGQILKSDIPQLNGILKINNNNLKFE
jgi:DNA/RNA endonuclease G (NUC1)